MINKENEEEKMSNLQSTLVSEVPANSSEQDRNSEAERSLGLHAEGAVGFSNNKDELLNSFEKWPSGNVLSPEILAEKGFKYSGQGDTVICTGCDHRFGGFQAGDDPDDIHAKKMPDCSLLVSRKGNKFIKQRQLQNKMEEQHEHVMKDVEEIKSKLEETEKQLIQMNKEKDRYEAEIRRLKKELQDLKRSHRQSGMADEEYRSLRDTVARLRQENRYLSERVRQQASEQRREIPDLQEAQSKYDDLFNEKANVVELLKLQAREMEKMIEKYRKQSVELEELKRRYAQEPALSTAQEACMEFGYKEEDVKAASRIYREKTAESLMKILMEFEEKRQCSQPADSGQLVVGGHELVVPSSHVVECPQDQEQVTSSEELSGYDVVVKNDDSKND